jgi:hypothetical protein
MSTEYVSGEVRDQAMMKIFMIPENNVIFQVELF